MRKLSMWMLLSGLTWMIAAAAAAETRTSQVGDEAVGGVGVALTLSGLADTTDGSLDGFIRHDLGWAHVYEPIPGTIVSATLRFDLIDADSGAHDLFAGIDATGVFIGTATGGDQGLPGPWRDLQQPPPEGSFDNEFVLDPSLYPDLADGTFEVFALEVADLTAWGSNRALLSIEFVPAAREIDIDIRPFSSANPIDPRSWGAVPVAVLGSEGFDVGSLDPSTLAFGPAGARPLASYPTHVNRDGLPDLLSFYRIRSTGIQWGDERACVTGETFEGGAVEGCDGIWTVSPLLYFFLLLKSLYGL